METANPAEFNEIHVTYEPEHEMVSSRHEIEEEQAVEAMEEEPQQQIEESEVVTEAPRQHREEKVTPNIITSDVMNRELEIDYDGGDDAGEANIDFVFNDAANERFLTDLLFCVQGLGSIKILNGVSVYLRGTHTDESLKDINRYCRHDDPENPVTRLELGKWDTFVNDLVPLLTTQFQDKQLSYQTLILMNYLTEMPSSTSSKRYQLLDYLRTYKECFCQKIVFEVLVRHLAYCVNRPVEQKHKKHEQMVELIISLIRNILVIPYTQDKSINLDVKLMRTMGETLSFDALNYLCQDFDSPMMQKLSLTFLEIYYNLFCGLLPDWLIDESFEESKGILAKLKEREDYEKARQLAGLSTRHSRFDAIFKVTRRVDGTSKLVSNPPFNNMAKIDTCKLSNQRTKPKVRKGAPIDLNNILFAQHDRLSNDILNGPIYPATSTQNSASILARGECPLESETKKLMFNFAVDFMENSYTQLIECCFEELQRESDRVDDHDKINYLVLVSFFLRFERLRYIRINKPQNKDFDISYIGSSLQIQHFELIYAVLVKEITKQKKKRFSYRLYHAGLKAFLELLYVIREMAMVPDSGIRKNANIIMQNVFYHDVTRLIKLGFLFCEPELHDPRLIQCVIEFIGIFFDLLEEYSKGKIMTLQTDRRIRKKKEKKEKAKEGPSAEGEEEGGEEPEENAPVEEEEEENEADEYIYRERKFNYVSEFATLADYNIISKILHLIKNDRLLYNPEEVNTSITKFITRIVLLLKAEWIFFQIDYLIVFNDILANDQVLNNPDHKALVDVIKKVLKSFFATLHKNKMLPIEALFRFADKYIKDDILNNYVTKPLYTEAGVAITAAGVPIPAVDAEEVENAIAISKGEKWTEYEDRMLIENFELYKDLDDCHDSLAAYFRKMGVLTKDAKAIRRRIKFLKLAKGGKEQAQKIMDDLYQGHKEAMDHIGKRIAYRNVEEENYWENLKSFIEKCLDKYSKFADMIASLTASVEEGAANPHLFNEFAIVPVERSDFEFMKDDLARTTFQTVGFKAPDQGEIYWRIPAFLTITEIRILLDKLTAAVSAAKEIVASEPPVEKVKKPQSQAQTPGRPNGMEVEERFVNQKILTRDAYIMSGKKSNDKDTEVGSDGRMEEEVAPHVGNDEEQFELGEDDKAVMEMAHDLENFGQPEEEEFVDDGEYCYDPDGNNGEGLGQINVGGQVNHPPQSEMIPEGEKPVYNS